LEEITPGDQAGLWGNTTNNNLALIDQAVSGVTPISFTGVSGTVKTLTNFDGSLDEARAAVLNITGIATGSNTVVVPNKQKTYLVRNATGQEVIFRTGTPSATYAVEAGNSILVFCDGNNNVFTGIQSPSTGTLSVTGGGTGATTFGAGGFIKSTGGTNALTSAATVNLSSEVSGTLPVARGGTGAGTFTSGSLLVGNGTSNFGTLTGASVGQVATWNGSTWTAAAPTTGGVTSVSGSGNITVSPTTGAAVVSIASNPTFLGTVSSSIGGFTSSLSNNGIQIGNSSVTIAQSSNEMLFTAGNVQSARVTSSGISCNALNTSGISSSGNTLTFGLNGGTPYMAVNTASHFPSTDNLISSGLGGNRWSVIFSATPTINTSDANEKQQIRDITSKEKAVGLALKNKLKAFKFNDAVEQKGSGARIHFGIIAQEVKAAFDAEGLNPEAYGVFCSDTLEDGTVRLGVRYEELFALIIGSL
jgi:hypothetical protein